MSIETVRVFIKQGDDYRYDDTEQATLAYLRAIAEAVLIIAEKE